MTEGRCTLCEQTYAKRGMARHLRSCLRDAGAEVARPTVHLSVSAAHQPEYWLHVGLGRSTTLKALDDLLRDVWVECCGHLSSFTIEDVEYVTPYREDMPMGGPGAATRDMDAEVDAVFQGGMEFSYTYDFGTPTELSLRVVDIAPGPVGSGATLDNGNEAVRVLARNEPPEIECDNCSASATDVCAEHRHREGPAWLCADCRSDHSCHETMLLPVVNSPRVGLCGFTG